MRHQSLEHRFVRTVPRELEPGVLYVSMEYATAVHSCCCGCGERVVTPFTPTDWKLTFDGESVSLLPSIGNWQLYCQSHYVIREGRILEAGRWTKAQVAGELRRDQAVKRRHYQRLEEGSSERPPTPPTDVELPALNAEGLANAPNKGAREGIWNSLAGWVLRLVSTRR